MKLKILSWNIWINGHFDRVAKFLRTANADIIGLQEVKDNDPERDVINYLDRLGYKYAFNSLMHTWEGKTYSHGPAIFTKTKYDISGTRTYILSEKDPRAAVRTDIRAGGETLHIFSTHLVHAHQQPSKEQENQAINLLGVLPKKRTIVMGDFNATPESVAIKKIQKVFVNTNPISTPTWSVYPEGCLVCKPNAINICLDYIFTSKDLKSNSFKVESSKGSDHLPISVIIEI